MEFKAVPHLDKVLHFIGGLFIGFVINSEVACFVGATKELLYDKKYPEKHTVDYWDFLATYTGGLIGAFIRTLANQ